MKSFKPGDSPPGLSPNRYVKGHSEVIEIANKVLNTARTSNDYSEHL